MFLHLGAETKTHVPFFPQAKASGGTKIVSVGVGTATDTLSHIQSRKQGPCRVVGGVGGERGRREL